MPFYLGRRKQGDLILFRWPKTPTKESHGHLFTAVIGPFKSKVGASYFARYGRHNPRIHTAGDAERLAREDPRMGQAILEENMSEEELATARECDAQDQLEYLSQTTMNLPVGLLAGQTTLTTQGEIPCLTGLRTN